MLHRFAKFVVACTVLLILAGSLVTSHDAGLSVPDWPTSYGWNMFTFPPSMWVGNILYEHGHRLIASTVGFLTIVLAVWLWLAEPRRWLRWLGVAALGAVVAQGLLGGLTVLFFLPAADLDGARRPRRDLLLHDGRDRALHVAGLDRRLRPTDAATPGSTERGHAAPRCVARDDGHGPASTRRFSSARRCGTPARGWRFRTSR